MIPGAAIKAIVSRIPLAGWTAAGAALAVAIPLGIQTVRFELADNERASLHAKIYDEGIGYRDRLRDAQRNEAVCERALNDQNAAVDAMAANASAAIARAEEAAQEARRNAAEAQARADRFLARPIQGETLAERVLDVDAAVLADLGGQER